MVAEKEQLINLSKRWDAFRFTEIVAAIKSLDDLVNEDIVWNIGIGNRYLASES
jgi:hypothetical protein